MTTTQYIAGSFETFKTANLATLAPVIVSGHCYDPLVGESDDYSVVLNEGLFELYKASNAPISDHCHCCNHRISYVVTVADTERGEWHFLGQDCYRTLCGVQDAAANAAIQHVTKAVAAQRKRDALAARWAAFVAEHGLTETVAWAKGRGGAASDIVWRGQRDGLLSDKQVGFLKSIHLRSQTAPTEQLPLGPQNISGTLIAVKFKQVSNFRTGRSELKTEITVELESGHRVWTRIATCDNLQSLNGLAGARRIPTAGEQVCFRASVESQQDGFVIAKRTQVKTLTIDGASVGEWAARVGVALCVESLETFYTDLLTEADRYPKWYVAPHKTVAEIIGQQVACYLAGGGSEIQKKAAAEFVNLHPELAA